jgi:ubiquinone biosynthesis accessory factor UbiJ
LFSPALNFPLIKFINRVLSDYPAARAQLQAHSGKLIAADVGPVTARMRVTREGEMELVGEVGGDASGESSGPDVSFAIPLSALPKLAIKDEGAFSQIVFSGDSELAATLSDIARNVEWDVEEDLSRALGDVAAHRIVDTAGRVHAWQKDAGQRLSANVAEYLTEERRAFISQRDLDDLTRHNETLRDDIARFDARLAKLAMRA